MGKIYRKKSIITNLVGLPKTGQTVPYVDYDDGYYQKGSSITPRFTDNGDGTVKDNVTGLMWVQDGAGVGCNSGTPLAWADAISFCEGLSFAGYTDWRLPNIKELMSIVDYGTFGPAIDTTYFLNIQSDLYWSGTTTAGFTGFAWSVDFYDGYVSLNDKVSNSYVLPVRSGQ